MFTQSWNMRFMSLYLKACCLLAEGKVRSLELKSIPPSQGGWWLCDAGKTPRTVDPGSSPVCPALGHVFMPYSKLLLKKVEGQNRERAFSNAHKYFLLLAQFTWRFASARVFRQALTVLGSRRWALSLSQCERIRSVTMATTFLSLTTTVN